MQEISKDILKQKYLLPGESTIDEVFCRVAKALSEVEEEDNEEWYHIFLNAMQSGCIPAGRIMSNAGAEKHKTATSLINCTVSSTIEDSLQGIRKSHGEAMETLHSGAGIGYDFSTLRPKGAIVAGVGATTSGPLPFMDMFDAMCFTISSAGGRRGAQMGCMDIHHPDIEDFITAKRTNGRLRQFNLSVLITNDFMDAVKNNGTWKLSFPLKEGPQYKIEEETREIIWRKFPHTKEPYTVQDGLTKCVVYKEVKAMDLWNLIMKSTYNYSEPGVLFIDNANKQNPLNWCEDLRATNPCAEQWLPPYGACLLGSIDVSRFIKNPFDYASFEWAEYTKKISTFTRMLDNVVEINNLPLIEQDKELKNKRRHGIGLMGIGTALNMLKIRYGSEEAANFLEKLCRILAIEGLLANIDLAKEKGPAPIYSDEANRRLAMKNKIIKEISNDLDLERDIVTYGLRFTHHTSIAPTGTIALAFGNNCSNGIEPSFMHEYSRNVIVEGKETKKQIEVVSKELYEYRQMHPGKEKPKHFVDTNNLTTEDHIRMMEAAQPWIDSAISKTVNVPQDIKFEDFKNVYMTCWESDLKGCATYRFNPENNSGVLVDKNNLKNTTYRFALENGEFIDAAGDEEVEYKGQKTTAANLADAFNEGYLGRL